MKKLIKSSLLILTSIFGIKSNAQTQTNENTLLWEISGKDLTKPSYLYGTVHMMCESDFKMTEKTLKAFSKSDKLALEIDMDDPSELAAMQQSVMGKEPLSKVLNAEEYKKLDVFLQEKVGQGAKSFENYSLLTIMSMVMLKSLNCPPKMYELEFMKMAMEKKIEIIGLEKLNEQIDFLNKAYAPSEMVEQLKYYGPEYFKELIPFYTSEQIQKIYQLTTDPKFMSQEDKKWMLDIRNNNWAKKMPEMMKKESVFFAVGAAHLAGEQGVIQLLKKAGYNVKPIMN